MPAVRETDVQAYLSALEGCGWLKHIRGVLDTTTHIVKYICNGSSVLVHCRLGTLTVSSSDVVDCSDGWDRTAQTCSLSALLLDPFYRTIDGFIVLVFILNVYNFMPDPSTG